MSHPAARLCAAMTLSAALALASAPARADSAAERTWRIRATLAMGISEQRQTTQHSRHLAAQFNAALPLAVGRQLQLATQLRQRHPQRDLPTLSDPRLSLAQHRAATAPGLRSSDYNVWLALPFSRASRDREQQLAAGLNAAFHWPLNARWLLHIRPSLGHRLYRYNTAGGRALPTWVAGFGAALGRRIGALELDLYSHWSRSRDSLGNTSPSTQQSAGVALGGALRGETSWRLSLANGTELTELVGDPFDAADLFDPDSRSLDLSISLPL